MPSVLDLPLEVVELIVGRRGLEGFTTELDACERAGTRDLLAFAYLSPAFRVASTERLLARVNLRRWEQVQLLLERLEGDGERRLQTLIREMDISGTGGGSSERAIKRITALLGRCTRLRGLKMNNLTIELLALSNLSCLQGLEFTQVQIMDPIPLVPLRFPTLASLSLIESTFHASPTSVNFSAAFLSNKVMPHLCQIDLGTYFDRTIGSITHDAIRAGFGSSCTTVTLAGYALELLPFFPKVQFLTLKSPLSTLLPILRNSSCQPLYINIIALQTRDEELRNLTRAILRDGAGSSNGTRLGGTLECLRRVGFSDWVEMRGRGTSQVEELLELGRTRGIVVGGVELFRYS